MSMSARTRFIVEGLEALADPAKAGPMAAYMKTDMRFYGVQAGPRRQLARQTKRAFPFVDRSDYETAVCELWERPHREDKYMAIALARLDPHYITGASLPMYERLIREGAWWDFVDEVAQHLVGTVVLDEPGRGWPVMDRWIDDADLWIRRTAILCQNRHKQHTDAERLFRYCKARASEPEFFIQKAIGWALRQYSYVAAQAVREFLTAMRNELAPLSYREGARELRRRGLLSA